MNILIIDNYDSFTYNIVQLIRRVSGQNPDVKRNDQFTINDIAGYHKVILSPGPGLPKDAGLMPEMIKQYAQSKSILGICLGHQAIAEAYGGQLTNMSNVCHGIASDLQIKTQDNLFDGLPDIISGARYHSWIIDKATLPDALEVLMEDDQGHIMAIRHKRYDLKGLQFHPESILTPLGEKIIANWINN